MTRTLSLISSVTALGLAVAATLFSVPGRAGGHYSEVQAFLANRVVPAMSAISSSIAAQSEEMAPP